MNTTQDKIDMRAKLESEYDEVLSGDEMAAKYTVSGFGMGLCVVRRKSDNQRGSLDFTHMPRFYFNFIEG